MGAPAVDVGAAVGMAGSAVGVGLATDVGVATAVAVDDMAVAVPDTIVEVAPGLAVEVDETAVLVGAVSSELHAAKIVRQDKRRK